VNAFLAHQVTYPPRTLRVRIVLDAQTPAPEGILPEALKARVESVSSFFEQAAGIRLSVVGYMTVKMEAGGMDPETLGRYIEVRTPRADADVLVDFWPAPENDSSLGSAQPYSPVAVVRLNSGSPDRDRAALAHQLLSLFGVPVSSDPQSVMNASASSLRLDPQSKAFLMEVRLFDFSQGLAGMNRRMQARILDALARQPDNHGDPPRLRLANLLMRDGHPDAAIVQYRSVIDSGAANLRARLGLARALSRTAQYPAAESEARAAVKLAPDSDDSHYELGYALVRSGNPEAAVEEFRRALSIAPNSARNHAGLAVAYFGSIGQFQDAQREFEAATKLEPKNPALLSDIEYVQRIRARIERESAAAELEVQSNPQSGPAHNRWAVLLLRQGKVAPAIDQVRQAIKLGPETWQMHYILAVALYVNRDFKGSQAELGYAKKLGSGSRPRLEQSLREATDAVR
jgi:Flp pilus assembly protein TadD